VLDELGGAHKFQGGIAIYLGSRPRRRRGTTADGGARKRGRHLGLGSSI